VIDDAQLIESTLAGKSAAFGQLVLKYQDRLYNTLVHLLGNAEDALDVAQEAFVQAFVKLDTFQQTSAFYTWLYRIAFNVAASHFRKKRPVASTDQRREAVGLEPIDGDDGPSKQLEREEQVRQVRQAITSLAEEYRVVVVLREIDGCSYEAIAEVLDVPVGTVRSRLHRARLQLRDLLKKSLVPEE
jgi:RNA polymerase sigma-70 factor (ECF subfamily)